MDDGDRAGIEQRRRAAVLAGDERAWQEWYDANYADLCAYSCWRCGGASQLSEEVVQETWLIAVRRIRSFAPQLGSFRAWLFGIAGNVIRDQLRLRRKRQTQLAALPNDGVPAAATPDSDRAERIALALATLAPRFEQALRCKYLEQMSVSAIAEAWGETSKAVESLLTRARQAFREAYDIPEHD